MLLAFMSTNFRTQYRCLNILCSSFYSFVTPPWCNYELVYQVSPYQTCLH
uniref:Uncharacterized protein n=1 Tax=Anguilla anguilla TaxID=7936 RepID=A0A0E9V9J0_ANGAN